MGISALLYLKLSYIGCLKNHRISVLNVFSFPLSFLQIRIFLNYFELIKVQKYFSIYLLSYYII